MPTDDSMLTAGEVARWAKVHVTTVWRWEAEGILPAVRVGAGIVRFRRVDVEELLTPKRAS